MITEKNNEERVQETREQEKQDEKKNMNTCYSLSDGLQELGVSFIQHSMA